MSTLPPSVVSAPGGLAPALSGPLVQLGAMAQALLVVPAPPAPPPRHYTCSLGHKLEHNTPREAYLTQLQRSLSVLAAVEQDRAEREQEYRDAVNQQLSAAQLREYPRAVDIDCHVRVEVPCWHDAQIEVPPAGAQQLPVLPTSWRCDGRVAVTAKVRVERVSLALDETRDMTPAASLGSYVLSLVDDPKADPAYWIIRCAAARVDEFLAPDSDLAINQATSPVVVHHNEAYGSAAEEVANATRHVEAAARALHEQAHGHAAGPAFQAAMPGVVCEGATKILVVTEAPTAAGMRNPDNEEGWNQFLDADGRMVPTLRMLHHYLADTGQGINRNPHAGGIDGVLHSNFDRTDAFPFKLSTPGVALNPTPEEMQLAVDWMGAVLRALDPHVILVFGKHAQEVVRRLLAQQHPTSSTGEQEGLTWFDSLNPLPRLAIGESDAEDTRRVWLAVTHPSAWNRLAGSSNQLRRDRLGRERQLLFWAVALALNASGVIEEYLGDLTDAYYEEELHGRCARTSFVENGANLDFILDQILKI